MRRSWPESSQGAMTPPTPLRATLIIPFRNESATIPQLIKGLKIVSDELDEIFLIDDQSEDDSFDRLQLETKCFPQLRVIQSPGLGKKTAISEGVRLASGDLILTSDADCFWQPGWVSQMKCRFADPQVKLVAGPVLPLSSSASPCFFEQTEWASILLVTQYAFDQSRPLMCSAANMAYRKQAFFELGGYEGNADLLSGDDEFLLKKVVQRFGAEAAAYIPSRAALVHTLAQPSWSALMQQRIRWASKWRQHQDWMHAGAALGAIGLQLVWVLSFALMLGGWKGLAVFVGIWTLKIFSEYLALGWVLRQLTSIPPWYHFIGVSVLHPLFVIGVGWGAASGKFVWKGRSTARNSIFA